MADIEKGAPLAAVPNPPIRDVPVDWEALEDAFENNAPEVHSYLHIGTGEVLRVVDGVADPEMHARIAADPNYMRVDPVSSREQYRWMERFILMVEEGELKDKLVQAIDGKGAFRRFKDVLMAYATERERWFAFRSERLRVFMEAWLSAHALRPVPRPVWAQPPVASGTTPPPAVDPMTLRRVRSSESVRQQIAEIVEALSTRDLDKVLAFAEFIRARRASRTQSHRRDEAPGGEATADDAEQESERHVR